TDMRVRLWNVATGKQIQQFSGPPNLTYPQAFSPDSKVLATSSSDNIMQLWEIPTGKELHRLRWADQGHPMCLTFSPDGARLVSGHMRGPEREAPPPQTLVRLWDVKTGKEIGQFQGPELRVYVVRLSADGKTLAAGDLFGTIHLWEGASGKERARFQGHRGDVRGLAFSPDGTLLASGSSDKTVLIWDVTGQLREGRLPALSLRQDQLECLWKALAGPDGIRAYRAIWTLAAAPRDS